MTKKKEESQDCARAVYWVYNPWMWSVFFFFKPLCCYSPTPFSIYRVGPTWIAHVRKANEFMSLSVPTCTTFDKGRGRRTRSISFHLEAGQRITQSNKSPWTSTLITASLGNRWTWSSTLLSMYLHLYDFPWFPVSDFLDFFES